jgi:type VI protein secretion system component VasA
MTTNNTKKAAGATNSNGTHTDTNGVNFPTDGTGSKATAIAPASARSSDKAAILTTLAFLFDSPDVWAIQLLITKKCNKSKAEIKTTTNIQTLKQQLALAKLHLVLMANQNKRMNTLDLLQCGILKPAAGIARLKKQGVIISTSYESIVDISGKTRKRLASYRIYRGFAR